MLALHFPIGIVFAPEIDLGVKQGGGFVIICVQELIFLSGMRKWPIVPTRGSLGK